MTRKTLSNDMNRVAVSNQLDMSLDDVIALTSKGKPRYRKSDEGSQAQSKDTQQRRIRNRWFKRTRKPINFEFLDQDEISEGEIPVHQAFRGRFVDANRFPFFEAPRRRNFASTEGRHVRVAGLDYSIMTSDLEELFLSVGPVEKCWVDFDRTDRSLGTGGVIFESPADARRAVQIFNGRLIDKQPLQLDLVQRRFPSRF